MNSLLRNLLILFFITGFSVLHGQNHQLYGRVFDTKKNPLQYTNIIATPLAENLNIAFAITDTEGRYKLNLRASAPYKIEISHLGFAKLTDTVNLIQEDIRKNYTLQESSEQLEQVVINQRMAIIVKEDTITYRTSQFKTGVERKLREILKKLPGVDVDRDGNVKINGKKVTKLLVEGKTFFTGSTKLALENIPADAVDEVVALDNYNEISFLKGLSDSKQLALNIKLKENKKEFIFGDIELGGGVDERFLFHPTLFYYSPKTSINTIGDINNIGKKSFTIKDYINFEGGFTSLLENSTSFNDIYSSDFAQFLNQNDFLSQKNNFSAGSISQLISPVVHLESFSIYNKGKTNNQEINTINYLTGGAVYENRETCTSSSTVFALNKLKLRYQPDNETDLAYEMFIKTSNGDVLKDIISLTQEDSTSSSEFQQPKNISINQEIRYNKQFSYKHISTVTANYSYNNQENNYDWLFNQPLFNNLIPYEEENNFFDILQNTSKTKHHTIINLKHYWILNKFNHIYPRIGISLLDESYTSLNRQLLDDGSIKSFQESEFNNNTHFLLNDNYIGVHYKVKLGNFIFKPGIMCHLYFWKVNQFKEEITNKQKSVFLPELNVKYELSSSEKIEFDYKLKTEFTNAQQYANRLRFVSFNQLYRGNEDLENELYHSALLSYRQFNLYKDVYIDANLAYTKRKNSIRNTTQIEGIDQVNTSIYISLPEDNYTLSGSFGKQLGDFRLTLLGSLNLSDYTRIINDNLIDYQTNNHSYTLKVETYFKDLPNFEIGYEQKLNNFKSRSHQNKFIQINPYATLNWVFLNNFILKTGYSTNYYKNINTNQISQFNIGNLSLYYNQEDNPWGFEIDINNIFDVRYKNENSFNQFLVMNTNIFIQPRTILFKLSYKL